MLSSRNISFALLVIVGICTTFSVANASDCSLRGVSLFLPAAINYDDIFPSVCTNRGQCLHSSSYAGVWVFPSGLNDETHRYTIPLDTCVPDGRMLLMTNTAANSAATASKGDRFSVSVEGTPVSSGNFVADRQWNQLLDGSRACYKNGLYYANITNILGTGAATETDPLTRSTNINVEVTSSTGACTAKTYYLKVVNTRCLDGDVPACAFTGITVNRKDGSTASKTDLMSFVDGTLPVGGAPLVATLPQQVFENQIYLKFQNHILLNHESKVQMSYSTYDSATGVWVPSGSPIVFTLHAYLANSTMLLPWDSTRINRYTYNMSSSYYTKECSVLNREIKLQNVLSGGVGDPQFVGLQGQSFQVHGYDGAVFNIISNKHFQLNSLFVFLTGPRPCPIMPSGQKSVACWSHDGSYLGDIGLKTNTQDEILIKPGNAETGFAQVTFNTRSLEIGETIEFSYDNTNLFDGVNSISNKMLQIDGLNHGKIERISTHELLIEISCFKMEIENVDGFVNLRRLSIPSAYRSTIGVLRTHGLLGQTWQSKKYKTGLKEVEGDVDDYVVEDGIFGNDFVFNQFATL